MEWLTKTPIAHRGLHKGFKVPENSMLAFKRAMSKGYAIELDVRITKDKQVVVFHDKNLVRLFRSKRKVNRLTYKELLKYSFFNTNEKIPLLKDVLKLIDGKVPVLIEIKNYGAVGEFEALVVDVIKSYEGEMAVCSFNPDVIAWFAQNQPNILRGMVFGDIHKFDIRYHNLTFLYRYLILRPHFVSLDYKLLDTFIVQMCRYFKVPLISWTINGKKKEHKAQVLVDNIIFEFFKPEVKIAG